MPRPRKPDSEKIRSPQIVVRLPDDLKARVESAAAARGKTITEYVRPILERAVKRAERGFVFSRN